MLLRLLVIAVLLVTVLGRPAAARPSLGQVRARALALVGAAGPRRCVVLDIDNSFADTRYRTRAAAAAFARRHPEAAALAALPIGRIGWNGRRSALQAGLDTRLADEFQSFWERFFWTGKNFRYDRPMRGSIELARDAARAGAEVFYLTGRVGALKRATLRELRRMGLPDADAAHVLCKPSVKVATDAFKRRSLEKLRAGGRRPAWFLSDSPAELRATGDLVSGIGLDFPFRAQKAAEADIPANVIRLRYGRR